MAVEGAVDPIEPLRKEIESLKNLVENQVERNKQGEASKTNYNQSNSGYRGGYHNNGRYQNNNRGNFGGDNRY